MTIGRSDLRFESQGVVRVRLYSPAPVRSRVIWGRFRWIGHAGVGVMYPDSNPTGLDSVGVVRIMTQGPFQ